MHGQLPTLPARVVIIPQSYGLSLHQTGTDGSQSEEAPGFEGVLPGMIAKRNYNSIATATGEIHHLERCALPCLRSVTGPSFYDTVWRVPRLS